MGKSGKLLFKGDSLKKKKKKSHKHNTKSKIEELPQQQQAPANETTTAQQAPSREAQSSAPAIVEPKMNKGTGKIVTSGTVVTGYETRFEKELGVGDALIVNGEMRVITMRLSNTSLNVSSGFSKPVSTPTEFFWIAKPRNVQQEQRDKRKRLEKEKAAVAAHAFGTYQNQAAVVREKTEHGSYRIHQVKTNREVKDLTRSDLLKLRSSKTSDKYC